MNTILLNLEAASGTRTHDFTTSFNRPIDISDGIYYIALAKLNFWFSFYNIAAQFNNNTFTYFNGTTNRTVTFLDGQYTIDQINDFVHDVMVSYGDFTLDPVTGQNVYDLNIVADYSTLRVKVIVTGGYTMDVTLGEIHNLLGFKEIVISTTQEGTSVANINRNINTIQLHCDICSATYTNSDTTDVLYTFIPDGYPGSNIEIKPMKLLYLPIRVPNQIRNIRIYFTDQLGRTVDLNQEPVSLLLSLKKISSA